MNMRKVLNENCVKCSLERKQDCNSISCERKSSEIRRFKVVGLRMGKPATIGMSKMSDLVLLFNVVLVLLVVTASAQYGKFADIKVSIMHYLEAFWCSSYKIFWQDGFIINIFWFRANIVVEE